MGGPRVVTGGTAAEFASLLERYRRALFGLALDRTGRPDVAEEIAQDVIVKAWEARQSLRDPAALRSWLFRMTLNACAGWYRREVRFVALPEGLAQSAVAAPAFEEVLRRQTIRDARKALAALPLRTRTAFLMQVLGYTYAETAAFLDLSPAAVRGRIARARERVRGALGARLQAVLPRAERNDHG